MVSLVNGRLYARWISYPFRQQSSHSRNRTICCTQHRQADRPTCTAHVQRFSQCALLVNETPLPVVTVLGFDARCAAMPKMSERGFIMQQTVGLVCAGIQSGENRKKLTEVPSRAALHITVTVTEYHEHRLKGASTFIICGVTKQTRRVRTRTWVQPLCTLRSLQA